MDFQFHMPTKLLVGEHIVEQHSAEFGRYGKKCLIITGAASAKKSGALAEVTAALDACQVAWQLFDGVGQNPLLSVCHQAGGVASAFGATFLVGIGGGSPLDATKAAAVFAANPELPPEGIYGSWANKSLPFLLVGTTAGTGSEVTRFSVLTQDGTGTKRSWGNEDSYARVAFGDPRYTMSLPLSFTMSTGLDAVAHALEAYFSRESDPISDLFALAALRVLLPTLREVWMSRSMPELAARRKLYDASIYAGLALNRCGTLFCHSMGYYLSEEVGIPHGYACAVFLPELIRYSVPLAPDKALELFRELGMYAQELCDLLAMMTDAPFEPISDQLLEKLLERWKGGSNMRRTLGNFDTEAQRTVARRILQKNIE